MPLSAPVARTPMHTRRVTYQGYKRDDGLWDIEATMVDTKPHRFVIENQGEWAPEQPIHHMLIRVTVNDAMVIQAIEADMAAAPHEPCPNALPPMQGLVGATLGRGWRKAIDAHLGQTKGCTHMRELLFNLATAAFQTMVEVSFERPNPTALPPHLGQCHAWDLSGPVVAKAYPMFYQPKAD